MTATEEQAATRPARPQPEPFGPGSILWDQMGLYTSALAGNCAFVLQVMHPAIGTVVDQRSSFRTDPVGRALRSFASVQTWVYGGRTAIEEGERLRRMHATISAEDQEGRTHHALSAEPWAWVHLTGFYAAVSAARYFATREPEPGEEQQVFEEFLRLGRILRVPERMLPATIADYWAYFDDMVENTLVGHRVAHDVLRMMDRVPPGTPALLRPAVAPLSAVAGRVGRFVAIGTLPPAARDKLGLSWSDADERRLRALGRSIARGSATLPERLRYMPIAYRARQAARARERLERALAERPV
ncbi:oxygenase MpaB family protein [Actinomadura sp. DC4]|uniref:oxygenase MpaB family protein n=1 Tax=Actinomadura sp. DC4 TaxID=3055069 RepID=UPI0025AF6D27|nr:oxygenase MpaB family protein [Actinomadura sp. DC4]MDN3351315.1 oxygenase MpaB family protein [Actinomadura sp. DC4]